MTGSHIFDPFTHQRDGVHEGATSVCSFCARGPPGTTVARSVDLRCEIRTDKRENVMHVIGEILHPTDFSKGAEPALEMAMELARRFEAQLTILHVYAVPVFMGPFGDGYALSPDLIEKLKADAERGLEQFRMRVLAAGVRCVTVAIEGAASTTIVAVAAARNMDLIVLGTHGRTGLNRFLLGSVAERVLRAAQCPVLTVRQPAL